MFYPISYLNPKDEDSSCKIVGFMATYTSKLKWASQTDEEDVNKK